MVMPGEATYFPSLLEILITVSIIAAVVFFFTLAVKTLPVFPSETGEDLGTVPDIHTRSGGMSGTLR
jgi:Ni/Fe-hydrogenase subunit HybB-like protein